MAPLIVILSEPTVSSYGTIGALYHETFRAMGIPSRLEPYPLHRRPRFPRGAIVLHNTLGFRFSPFPGVTNIAVPFHEWSRYPPAWATRLNGFDEVWAASAHLAHLLRGSGVSAPIRFAPPALTLDPPQVKRSWTAHRPFRFLFVGEPHFRKGHHLLIAGFKQLQASRRTATLTIKTSADCPWTVDDGRIRVVAARWSPEQVRHLYRAHDAFVSASLGEGLGLGVAEAMLARLPVATNRWGGHTSLLVRGGYVGIPHRVVAQPFCSRPDFFAPGQQCALSSADDVASAMHQLMTMTARRRGDLTARADAAVRRRFGFTAAAGRLRAALAATHEEVAKLQITLGAQDRRVA
jgi:glycosyltransferase involved in cell wall biosynthesis